MGRRKQRRSRQQRGEKAREAQSHLTAILMSPLDHPRDVVESAAVHLSKVSQRHRLSLPSNVQSRVCRKCWGSNSFTSQFRVRIKAGQRIHTCLRCGTIRRYGAGPKAHRIARITGGVNE